MSDFCAVCGDKASKWRYSQYSATSCFSCRTFYRRSVENKVFKKYKCRSRSLIIGFCEITITSRKRCAFCRYKKCRRVGMKHGQPHWEQEDTQEFDLETESPVKDCNDEALKLKPFEERQASHDSKLIRQDFEVKSPRSLERPQRIITSMDTSMENDQFSSCSMGSQMIYDEEVKSPTDPQQGAFVDHLLSHFDTPTFEEETFDVFENLQNQNDLIHEANAVWSTFHQAQGVLGDTETSMDHNQPRKCDFTNQDDENERIHFEHMMHIPNPPKIAFTIEEKLYVERLVQIDKESKVPLRDNIKSLGSSMIKQFITSVITGRPLNFSAVCWGYACAIQKLTRFAVGIPEFIDATKDQSDNKKCLLIHNIDPMFNIRNAFFFQDDTQSILCQLDRFGIFEMELLESLSTVFRGITANVKPMAWKQYFVTPWADSLDQEEKYESLMASLHNLSLDRETTCILSAVALFSTQSISQSQLTVPLENFRKHQYGFALLLYRYLMASRGENVALAIFPGFLSTLTKLREMSEILKNKTIKIGPSPNVEEQLDLIIYGAS